MIIIVFHYIEMIIERPRDIQSHSGVGWLPSQLWPDLEVIDIQKTYCETF